MLNKNSYFALIFLFIFVLLSLIPIYLTYQIFKEVNAITPPLKIKIKNTRYCQTERATNSLDHLMKTTLK